MSACPSQIVSLVRRFRSSETFARPCSGFRKPRVADVFGRSRSLHGRAFRPGAVECGGLPPLFVPAARRGRLQTRRAAPMHSGSRLPHSTERRDRAGHFGVVVPGYRLNPLNELVDATP